MYRHNSHLKEHIDMKLIKRVRIYLFVSIIMIGIAVYGIIITGINPLFTLWIFLVSIIIGFFVSRMFHIFWDEDTQVVTSRIDTYWWIILWIYILFSFTKRFILNSFIPHSFITVTTFAIISGIMIGRFVSMRNRIRTTLQQQNIL